MIRKIIKAVERLFHWDEFGEYPPSELSTKNIGYEDYRKSSERAAAVKGEE